MAFCNTPSIGFIQKIICQNLLTSENAFPCSPIQSKNGIILKNCSLMPCLDRIVCSFWSHQSNGTLLQHKPCSTMIALKLVLTQFYFSFHITDEFIFLIDSHHIFYTQYLVNFQNTLFGFENIDFQPKNLLLKPIKYVAAYTNSFLRRNGVKFLTI